MQSITIHSPLNNDVKEKENNDDDDDSVEEAYLDWSEWNNTDRVMQVYGVGLIYYFCFIKSLILVNVANCI